MTPNTDTPAPANQPRNETVLLVDDYDPGRPGLRDYLSKAGFTVLDANNGEEAYQVCDRHAGPVHLLITDVRVSAQSQPELAPTLEASRA
jgi:two-component system cell cycle sensor histidine kinase/response regulator CckA